MGDLPKGKISASSIHTNILQEVVGSDGVDSKLYSYTKSFSGFVANLTSEEAQKLKGTEGVMSVFPNENKRLHTTRSWDFMGFPNNVNRTTFESDIIIGMFDTGIWPESESFNDQGFGPPPKRWRGNCQESSNFTCNNKIIGARYYRSKGQLIGQDDFDSPRDSEGHGTHTASIAAGNLVNGASLLGLGLGTTRGGVPSARIAVYKICWSRGCSDADILAAFDDAISDGVDIISLSVGGLFTKDYFDDSIAIGAFHAMKNGILTSNSAGNYGPSPASVTNVSPWSLTVAATTTDRKFVTNVKLGNGELYEGLSINTFDLKNKMFPIIYGGDAPSTGSDPYDSRLCLTNTIDKKLVEGKILLCDMALNGEEQLAASAAGTIMQDTTFPDVASSFLLPASCLGLKKVTELKDYYNSSRTPTATIQKSIEGNDELAPYVATFSSRGPNPITRDILKPDLTAPGVDILAAWSEATTVTGDEGDTRIVPYNIVSGTSMSCPHATAAAAYVKSFHPTWSPAAIKSALMTTESSFMKTNLLILFTVYPISVDRNTDAEFAYGAGQINPIRAINPGLIYDAGEIDYVDFLCGQGYSSEFLRLVTSENNSCPQTTKKLASHLNYPSFTLSSKSKYVRTHVFPRTVTNVGSPMSTYKAIVNAPTGLKIKVIPNVLSFKSLGQKKSFLVKVTRLKTKMDHIIISGSFIWYDGVHQVRSPIIAQVYS
ncbi:cucumisin-like [Quercus robur]|uniref:cucumisin-like n=1 Tax=Quercus robur TaxID=38942 RepID=UPI00216128B2|nr:cucumisin-like [Quercus robur]